MPPIRKVQLDKAAWLWAESDVDPCQISDDNIDIAYRGNVPKCKLGSCRRNCRGNPYCLSGMGESRWLSNNNNESEEDDADLHVRSTNDFVGLKNLGATCYVNSLVQLLFHNLAFRKAIFSWNPLEDPMEVEDSNEENERSKSPQTVVGHLQFLFGLMQFGKRKSIDPLDFIKALDLEPSMQQDAQEFSKLLFSLLEDSLNQQSDPNVKNLIIDNFRGEYSYITRCSKCNNDSVSPSMFYELELNIKGYKTLHESIAEFLKEEKLEGVNMYHCSYCTEKQEATRFINLEKLPLVLNLQLMRFIYDRQKGHKKKISSSLQFPDTLDMSPYMNVSGKPNTSNQPLMYNLTAVLIHKGPSANSGHYVAHICDQTSGTWYKFNDELVEKMEGKQLKLGSEEEEEDGAKKVKKPRLSKGYLESSNAYMLVYTAQSVQDLIQPITETNLRPELLQWIQNSNEAFDKLIQETKEEKKLKKVDIQVYKVEMASLLDSMPVASDGVRDWEAFSCKWLTQWLANTNREFKPVDNSNLLCPHGKLQPELVSNAKYISLRAADTLFQKYGGGPRLPANEAICRECVTVKCRSIKFRTKLIEDAKDISILAKQRVYLETGYWIGKRSLKDWRKKALAIFEGKEGNSETVREVEECSSPSSDNEASCSEMTNSNPASIVSSTTNANNVEATPDLAINMNGQSCNGTNESKSRKRRFDNHEKDFVNGSEEIKCNNKSDEEEADFEEFNEDVTCQHGKLTPDENAKKLVSEDTWRKLKYYFPDVQEFTKDAEVCPLCKSMASQDQASMDLKREQAVIQKELLYNLLHGRNRPKLQSVTLKVVSVPEFLRPWKKFVREYGRAPAVYSLRNSTLVCVHGGLLYNPASPDDFSYFYALHYDEWNTLKNFCSVDCDISVTYGPDEGEVIETSPDICDECLAARMASEQEALLQYEKAKIYIRRMSNSKPNKKEEPIDVPAENTKRTGSGPKMVVTSTDIHGSEAIRRSTRHRRTPGEKELYVSSTDSLRDLKLKILNVIGVAPFDQHIFTEDGTELTDSAATLSSMNIFPNTVLTLRVDEPTEDSSLILDDEFIRSTEPESGFKGTVLLKR